MLLELFPRRADGAAPRATTPPAGRAGRRHHPGPGGQGGQPGRDPDDHRPGRHGRPGVAAAGEPTAAVDPASRSPLAFTGSTALSMLGASVLLMLVGVAALFASRRRYHHRH